MTFADSSCINYMKCLTFTTAGYYFLLKTIHHLIQIKRTMHVVTMQVYNAQLVLSILIRV